MNERQRLKEIIGILKDNDILGGINPTKFCTVIEQLGPTFIKIGQRNIVMNFLNLEVALLQ